MTFCSHARRTPQESPLLPLLSVRALPLFPATKNHTLRAFCHFLTLSASWNNQESSSRPLPDPPANSQESLLSSESSLLLLLSGIRHFCSLLCTFVTFVDSYGETRALLSLLHFYSRNRAGIWAQNTVSCRPESPRIVTFVTFLTFSESTLFLGRNPSSGNPGPEQGSTRHLEVRR